MVGYNYLDRKLGGVDEGNKRYQEDSIPITMDDYVIPGEVRLSVGKGRGSTGTAPSITDSNQYRILISIGITRVIARNKGCN